MHRVAIHWLRRDLRLADNTALNYACEHAKTVVLVYIHAPDEEAPWSLGAASRWWLHRSLESLGASLRTHKHELTLREGPSTKALKELIEETGATLVTWNRLYDPAVIERDTAIKASLQDAGIEVHSVNAALLFEPWEIKTQQATPFRVFTPFWRACNAKLDALAPPQGVPELRRPRGLPQSLPLAALALNPKISWDAGLAQTWRPGEQGAHELLDRFIATSRSDYKEARDIPSRPGTSHLSPHLHFGEIGPKQIVAAMHAHPSNSAEAVGRDHFIRELGWREFAHHVLFHFPHTHSKPFDPKFEGYPWEKNRAGLKAWQRGNTGIPIIDAGMRELWHTGYMHNRVRMLVASLLTKNLRLHWLEGARWFWDTLVDADLANNSLGWQWTAGCGTDAAPYFRIFNPVTQGERFDAEGKYVRRWVPELARLPDKWIHKPWDAPDEVLRAADVRIGKSYPRPIVDLGRTRTEALDGYKTLRSEK